MFVWSLGPVGQQQCDVGCGPWSLQGQGTYGQISHEGSYSCLHNKAPVTIPHTEAGVTSG